MLPKRCNRGTVSYMKRERVPKDWGIGGVIVSIPQLCVGSTSTNGTTVGLSKYDPGC